ncbi:winged helix DNA-binding protein [Novosphingobium sp. Gsoil 351]|uniref:helix-turn-helix domain-containing protein n=1 Tax=Novosphingobium sp. Gsoil 351 TaxID=2675225 RepID=UPI0012B49DF9|nr:winged helix DNA-binding protein [Novosphingobium sp. Gsoil 351]QGN53976.1 winged helix DNA-binding protein [Novosphingobium sp. Gsoil 351]
MKPSADRYMSASELAAVLVRLEVAMVRTIEGFARWSATLHRCVSGTSIGAQEVWLLHGIRMRGGPQNLSELLQFLNRNDVSTIQYSLRKIESFGLIERVTGGSRREAGYRLTESGEAATGNYAAVREAVLVGLLENLKVSVETMQRTAESLEQLTGIYDQTTQQVLNRRNMGI